MITTSYRVEVTIPEELFEYLDLIGPCTQEVTREYQRATIEATKGNDEAGTDYYHHNIEYAVFSDIYEARRCEERLEAVMIKYWQHMKNNPQEEID